MASISPSSSPRWDTRNAGFISPSQLQLLKQQEEQQQRLQQLQQQQYQQQTQTSQHLPELGEQPTSANRDAHAPTPAMFRTSSSQPTDNAPTPSTAAPTHSRTSSAFSLSLFKSKAFHSHSPSASSTISQTTGEHGELPRNGHGQSMPSTASAATSTTAVQGDNNTIRSSTPRDSMSLPAPPPLQQPLHPEIRSIVQLTVAHSHKVYFSGQLIRHNERQPDGQRPHKDEGWRDVWGQLGGTNLSLWDMAEIEEASKQGRQVPPTYINVTDAVSKPILLTAELLLLNSVSLFSPPPRSGSLLKCWDPLRYPQPPRPRRRSTPTY